MNKGSGDLSVSVALCTHNGARFIAEQVSSILGQDYPISEIVISDDASADETVAIAVAAVEGYSAAHPERIVSLTVLRNESPLGVARNFAQAIVACASGLVALSDQDDVWLPGRLSAMVAEFAERESLTLAHSDALRIDAAGEQMPGSLFETLGVTARELAAIGRGDALRVFVRRNLATGATTVFRRALADVALPVPVGWIHDEWLAIVAAATGLVSVDRRPLIAYRQHESNQIGASTLDLSTRLDRLREPRTPRNARLLARATSLVERFEALGPSVSQEDLDLVRGKLRHERFRSALPPRRAARVVPVLARVIRGEYGRFGLGAQDVLRDLVQPVA